jgi:hypothetical protein
MLQERHQGLNGPEPVQHSWYYCPACRGQVGVASTYREDSVLCPGCGANLHLNQPVLYRPPLARECASTLDTLQAEPKPKVYDLRTPSIGLMRMAENTLAWGIASVVLGWTLIVPLLGLFLYIETRGQATKEQVELPSKASWGLACSLLFGVVQTLAMISYLNKH